MKKKLVYFCSVSIIMFFFILSNQNAKADTLPAIGNIDSPNNGATIKGTVSLSGWFLDPNGVSKIEVDIDGKSVGIADYGKPRSDVLQAFPQYNNGNSGFLYSLNTKILTNGPHSFSIKEFSSNNSTNVVNGGSFIVDNLPAKGHIDSPSESTPLKGVVLVKGWFLDGSDVSSLDILVDGQKVGTATYHDPRPDVGDAFPNYQNINSGFHYSLDTKPLTNGKHTLSVKETGQNQGVTTINQTITVSNLQAKGFIDKPNNGASAKGIVPVTGWFLDGSDVSNLDILVDGNKVGTATYHDPRPDVGNAFPNYQNNNSGFHYSLDTKPLTNGKHTLSVKETGQNQGVTTINQTITVSNLPAKGFIDNPNSGASVKGIVPVTGWFLDGSNVDKINILVDGKKVGTATYNDPRSDVASAYPTYQNSNAGFHYSLDARVLLNGKHTLTVQEIGNNKAVTSINRSINAANLPAVGMIDSPFNGSTLEGVFSVNGWFLDGSDVASLEVLVDGKKVGDASYNISRPDVLSAYPNYNNSKSGFHYSLDSSLLPVGQHTLTVLEKGYNELTTAKSINFNVGPIIKHTKYNISLNQMLDLEMNAGPLTDLYGHYDYVSKDYVYSDGVVHLSTGILYVRDTPDGIIVGSLKNGDQVTILGTDGNWYKIYYYWKAAKSTDVAYYLNPDDFSVNSKDYFQFLDLSSSAGLNPNEVNAKILYNKGSLQGQGQSFIDAANKYNINEIYLISHALLETGNGTSDLATGKYVINGKKVYNMYGIGAVDNCSIGSAEVCGAQYAYDHQWFTVQDAIIGGAQFISQDWIQAGQNTLYKMRWNPDGAVAKDYATHQYASDIGWADKQVDNIANLYGLLSTYRLVFDVPQYQ